MAEQDRRMFLISAAGLIGVGALGWFLNPGFPTRTARGAVSVGSGSSHGAHGTAHGSASAGAGIAKAWRDAPIDDYVLDLGMRVQRLGPYRARLRTYGLAGQAKTIPGPLLETRPGHVLRVKMRNRIGPKGSGSSQDEASAPLGLDPHNNPHDFDVTNLHVHGLQVRTHIFSPIGTLDPLAPMVRIPPGEDLTYTFEIPENHPAGLFAYHPHWHGSTATQVMSGAAGAIVVRGDIDEVPEIAACREVILAVNSVYLNDNRQPPGRYGLEFTPYEPPGRGGFAVPPFHLYTVNGRPVYRVNAPGGSGQSRLTTSLGAPTIRMRPGEIIRVRLLNATALDVLQIVATAGDMRWFAQDGIQFPRPVETGDTTDTSVFMPPLGRSEVLLRAPDREGSFAIRALANTLTFQPFPEMTLARVVVSGSRRRGMRFPSTLPVPTREYPLIRPRDVVRERTFEYSMERPYPRLILDQGFLIDEQSYDEDVIAATTYLGAVERWTFRNTSPVGHPVHIHVNSMQVQESYVTPTQPRFCDVLWVPAGEERSVYMRFKEWPGKTVMHCHILPHEDQGMMTNIFIRRRRGA